MSQRKDAAPREWSIQISRSQFVQTVGIGVGDRQSGVVRQLPLHRKRRLHDVGRPQVGADFLYYLGGLEAAEGGRQWDGGEEVWFRDHILLLHNAVVALGCQRVAQTEAVVKHAESRAK